MFLKVLHIHGYDKGGGAETVFNITRNNKHNLINYSGYIKKDISDIKYPEVKFKIYQSYPRHLQFINYIFSFHNYFVLKNFLLNNEVDVVHVHGFIGALSTSILFALRKVKSEKRFIIIQTMHDFHLACPNSLLFDYGKNIICEKCLGKRIKIFPFFNSCDRRGYLFSIIKGLRSIIANNLFAHKELIDRFIAPSNLMREKLIEEGISENKIVTIRNPIPISTNDAKSIKKNVICYFGRFSKEKDIPFIIESFSFWKKKGKNDFKLLLVGNGEEEQQIKRLVDENIYKKDITLMGFKPFQELMAYIEPCKYFMMASRLYENAPMTILEAVSLNIIPIVPDLGGMKETIESVVMVGKTYKLGDKESFLQNIEELELNYSSEIEKIFHMKRRIHNLYGFENYLKELNDLYRKTKSAHDMMQIVT